MGDKETLLSRREFLIGLERFGACASLLPDILPNISERYLQNSGEYEAKWRDLEITLVQEINRYKNNFMPSAEITISVLDLQTNRFLSIDGETPWQPGCVINQFVLYSLVEDFKAGLYSYEPLAREIYLAVGESKADKAKNLLALTGDGSIEAGVKRVNQKMQSLALKTSFMDHPPAFGHEFSLQGSPNLMTTNEAVQIMAKLYRNELFEDPLWTSFTTQRLIEGKRGLNYMIGIALRDIPGVRVAHKIGYFPNPADKWRWADNDAGLVLIKEGDKEIAYAMAIFSKGNKNEFSIVYDGWFTWRVSRTVYDFFKEQYLG